MALANIHFPGASIGLATAMNVILPNQQHGAGPFPVFYLLHGLSDDETIWSRHTSIERYAANLPLIIVMPTTARGWYTNSKADPKRAYEDHIIKDIIPFIDRTFHTINDRKGRVIGGLSMGGYGAIKLALKYPQLFCSAVSHSGAVAPFQYFQEDPRRNADFIQEFVGIFGEDAAGGDNDPLALAEKCHKKLRPALRIDCGQGDSLIGQNRALHRQLDKLRYPHEYQELPADPAYQDRGPLSPWTGGHDWNYWDLAVQHALVFHCKQIKIPLTAAPAGSNPSPRSGTSKKHPRTAPRSKAR
jgi:S-formylglutathione hydrolase FrmB